MKKLEYNYIKSEFAKEGYQLLTEEHINSYQKLDYVCPRGHRHSISWNDWRSGCRCAKCANISISDRFSGSGHPGWKGGISFEPYSLGFNGRLKKLILKRNNYQCQNPDCWGTMPEKLTVHHIDYNKENCDSSNLITLCRSCNGRANANRNYWTKFYIDIVLKSYIDN
jgi:hypothetical protein